VATVHVRVTEPDVDRTCTVTFDPYTPTMTPSEKPSALSSCRYTDGSGTASSWMPVTQNSMNTFDPTPDAVAHTFCGHSVPG
jgi:hypothetical protein